MKSKTGNYDVGVVVGRFQVAELHEAHKELIDSVRAQHPRTVIILGLSSVIGTRNNPLGFEPRRQMIQESYPDVDVMYVKDTKSDKTWSHKIDEIVRDLAGPNSTAVLYGSRDSFIKCYSGRFPTLELVATKMVSGTDIREALAKKAKPSYDWRAGAIHQAYQQYPKVYPTVDMAIFRDDKVLFVKKPNEQKWRFPGGFAEPPSNSFEEDALREALEETKLHCANPQYVGSFKIEDWRYRGEVDSIKTLFFTMEANDLNELPEASDDVNKCQWFDPMQLSHHDVEDEHVILLLALQKRLSGKSKVG